MKLAALVLVAGCDWFYQLPSFDHAPPDAMPPPGTWMTTSQGSQHGCGIKVDHTLWCWGDNRSLEAGQSASTVELAVPTQVGDATWTAVAAGNFHTCAIQSDATLWCWGDDSVGELGIGVTGSPMEAIRLLPMMRWLAVAAGNGDTCAIRDDHTMWCWGYNNEGEVGVDGAVVISSPTEIVPDPGGWVAVSSGTSHTCALDGAGGAWCWGYNADGELGYPTVPAYSKMPIQLAPATGWSAIAAGTNHSCGIVNGVVRCWGDNVYGQLGDGTTTGRPAPTIVNDPGSDWVGVTAGTGFTCGWRSGGGLACWGSNANGQLTFATDMTRIPTTIDGTWTTAAAGIDHMCAIDQDRNLFCAGRNSENQLATGDGGDRTAPAQVAGQWSAVNAGGVATCGHAINGDLACWGNNMYGQLGDGSFTTRQLPVVIASGGHLATALAVGHSCDVHAGGGLYCAGEDTYGELGNTNIGVLQPVPMMVDASMWSTVATGSHHTCGVHSSDGSLWCWGADNKNQIGDGTGGTLADVRLAPVPIGSDTWTRIALGDIFSCGIAATGTYCWGDDSTGQLGTNGVAGTTPTAVVGGHPFLDIAAGSYHVCAIENVDYALYCWGYNNEGELGDNDTQLQARPFLIGSDAWSAIAGGDNHTCGIHMDGSLWCWGSNDFGQLGDHTHTSRHVPTRVDQSTDWRSVTGGRSHTCATKTDDSLWCWGRNEQGEIGDGHAWRAMLVRVP